MWCSSELFACLDDSYDTSCHLSRPHQLYKCRYFLFQVLDRLHGFQAAANVHVHTICKGSF